MIIFTLDANGKPVPVQMDANGNIPVVTPDPVVRVPYSSFVQYTNLALPAGASTQTVWTVPANEWHKMSFLSLAYGGTVAGVSINMRVTRGVTDYIFKTFTGFITYQFQALEASLIIGPGDTIRAAINGATLNDDFLAYVFTERLYP